MHLFKIKIWQLLLILIIGLPAGYLFYQNNANKIIFSASIGGGVIVTEDYCAKYAPAEYPPILSSFAVSQLQENSSLRYRNRQPTSKNDVMLRQKKESDVYEFAIGGKSTDLSLMQQELLDTIGDIARSESKAYKENFSNYKLHCQEKTYDALRYLPKSPDAFIASSQQAYSKLKLFISFVIPSVILYLLFISFGYIKSNYQSLIRRN